MSSLAARLFERKSIEEINAEGERSALRRALGPLDLTLLGVGAIVGAGIFATIGEAGGVAGPAVVVSFTFTAFACALAGLCYAELTSVVPIAGSAYTYAYATLGEFIAWVIGWDLILEYAIGNVGVAISWGDYTYSFLQELGIRFPAWLVKDPRFLTDPAGDPALQKLILETAPRIAGHPVCFNLLAVLITVLTTILLVRGVRESATVNNGIVFLKLAVLLFVIGIGVTAWDTTRWGLSPFDWNKFAPNGWAGIAKGAGLLFFSYIGFDAVSTAAEETKNPGRDLPVGILSSLLVCTVLYIAIGFVATGLVPYEELKGKADPLAVAVGATGLGWAKIIVSLGAMFSMTAVLIVFQMGQPRILMSMARDGMLPEFFARVHPRYGTPAGSTILTGVVVGLFSAFANISEIVNLVNIGTLFAFVIVCVGTLVLRVREPHVRRPFRTPAIWLVAPLGTLTCVYLMTQLGPENWSRLAFWLLIGLNVYFGYAFVRKSQPAHALVLRRRVAALFALLLGAAALFLWRGDSWLGQPAGEGAPRTLWDVWVGFPPGMAHGMALFFAALAVWNLWNLSASGARRA
jgi:APA family basic amino acid/polyamine antiporter